ncbi:MAG: amidohydrolase family protein, partial [Planctomycetaceae bacterium]
QGRIVALGAKIKIPAGTQILKAHGLQVYPGMIDSGTTLGLVEIKKVDETQDHSESGGLQPDLRAGVAINPDSELIPVARAGGITTVMICPSGGTISGQSSVAKLSGWTAPEMVLRLEAGLHVNWPNGVDSKALKELTSFLDQGRQYQALVAKAKQDKIPSPIADPRLDALAPYLSGEKPVFVEANSREQIAEALVFAEKQKLKIVIAGGADAWKLAAELKARDVPVIVGPVMRSPVDAYDPYDAPYANPGRLHEAGVRFCIRSNNASNSRNTPFEAAMAVAYGLPEDVALRAVTLSAAEILEVADQLGSLTPGKRANLIITDGSPLQQTSQIKAVFIDGEAHQPTSRHSRLYHRYRRRLHEVQAKKPR